MGGHRASESGLSGVGIFCSHGSNEPVMEKNANANKEACLSREGQPVPPEPNKRYTNMKFYEGNTNLPDYMDSSVKNLRENTDIIRAILYDSISTRVGKCCTGGKKAYTGVCFPEDEEVKKKYGLCANPDKFMADSTTVLPCRHYNRLCFDRKLSLGRCVSKTNIHDQCHDEWNDENGKKHSCKWSAEDCEAKGKEKGKDFEYVPMSYKELFDEQSELVAFASICCEDHKLNDQCHDLPIPQEHVKKLKEVPTQICKSGNMKIRSTERFQCVSYKGDVNYTHVQTYCSSHICKDMTSCHEHRGKKVNENSADDIRKYADDLEWVGELCTQRQQECARKYNTLKGKCGVKSGTVVEERCHDNLCKMSKEGCENYGECKNMETHEYCHDEKCKISKEYCERKGFVFTSSGYTFQPYTEIEMGSIRDDFKSEVKGCCESAEDVNVDHCVVTEQIVPDGVVPLDYIDTSIGDGCKGGACCGSGTKWFENACVPTREGMVRMCKEKRGKWAWTCTQEAMCQ